MQVQEGGVNYCSWSLSSNDRVRVHMEISFRDAEMLCNQGATGTISRKA